MQWIIRQIGMCFSFVEEGNFFDEKRKLELDVRAAFDEELLRKISKATKLGLERRKKLGLPLGWPKGKFRKITPEIRQKVREYYFINEMTYEQIKDQIKKEYGISISLWSISTIINSEQ